MTAPRDPSTGWVDMEAYPDDVDPDSIEVSWFVGALADVDRSESPTVDVELVAERADTESPDPAESFTADEWDMPPDADAIGVDISVPDELEPSAGVEPDVPDVHDADVIDVDPAGADDGFDF